MSSFEDHFWGEKNNGFNVLYHNMKYGLDSSKEYEEFLRESCVVEESYVKLQAKLARYASNCNSRGSFAPFWQILRTYTEKLSNIHQQLWQSWQELMRDVRKYTTDQQKKHREMKDQEAKTLDAVQCIQTTVSNVHKAKENYHARTYEFEKLKRENANQKDLERAEIKMKRAHDEYRTLIDRYTNVRNEFEVNMNDSCKRFQELEEKHLQQMKDFVEAYTKSWDNQYALLGQILEEFRTNSNQLTIEKLIESFVTSKSTGCEKPGPIEFVEPDLSALPLAIVHSDGNSSKKEGGDNTSQGSASDATSHTSAKTSVVASGDRTFRGIFKHRTKKPKKHIQGKDGKDPTDTDSAKNVPQVDEEGYIIRPDNPMPTYNHDSSGSSSDSDTEPEMRPKLSVAIRPIAPNHTGVVDNVADIRSVIQGLRLSPTITRRTPVNDMVAKSSVRHSTSVLEGMSGTVKPSDDLIDLDLFSMSSVNSANVTTLSASSSISSPSVNGDKLASAFASPPDALDTALPPAATSNLDDSITSLSFRHRVQSPPAFPPLLAGPVAPSRSSRTSLPSTATARPTGRQTPDLFRMERTDSASSMGSVNAAPFNTSISFGTSRGPSPITIGMSDTVPLAVAFSETVQAYFRGSNPERCQVKMTGDMIVSFPAAIVRVLMDNPCPNTISFRIKNISSIEQFLINKLLIVEDESQSNASGRVFSFNMASLAEHLRRQTEQNKLASYFNIDILKYQIKTLSGFHSVPLQLASFWHCDDTQADFRLDYVYNSSAFPAPCALSNVNVMLSTDAAVTSMQSQPAGTWSADNKRALWKLGDITASSENGSQSSLCATFNLAPGSSNNSAGLTAVQFSCEGTTLSSIDFELAGPGYRVSLVKKRVVTGKYVSAVESDNTQKS